jgi:hypothetical protein
MNEIILFLFLIIGLAICFADWRKGVFFCISAGFLQDPIRKIIPDQPVYLSATIAVFAFAAFLGAKMRVRRLNFEIIHSMKGILRGPLNLFIALVLVQGIISFITTQSAAVAGIGLIGYLSPLPVLILGIYFVRDMQDINRLMFFYIIISAVISAGIYLSFMGYDWDILQAVGTDLYIYPLSGGAIKLHSGFLRSSEVSAWHAGTSICLVLILLLTLKNKPFLKWLSAPLILYFLIALILTGRRKIIVEIVMFLCIYGFLLLYFRRGAIKLAAFTLVIGLIIAYMSSTYLLKDADSELQRYFERPKQIPQSAVERLEQMTIGSYNSIIARNGFFGSGAGIGSQGAQHFGGGVSRVGGAAEGGLGKVLAELGVPGLALFLWLLIALLRYLKWILDESKNRDFLQTRLIFGMVAFLVSNAIVFATAHQIFGDIFVIFILGFVIGMVFGLQKIHMVQAGEVVTDS